MTWVVDASASNRRLDDRAIEDLERDPLPAEVGGGPAGDAVKVGGELAAGKPCELGQRHGDGLGDGAADLDHRIGGDSGRRAGARCVRSGEIRRCACLSGGKRHGLSRTSIHTVPYSDGDGRCTRTPRSSWIDEGLRALAAGGPDAVRIELLAQALGVTRGGFYWHFDDRRALLEEMLDAWERVSVDEVIERVEGEGGNARARLRRLFALAVVRRPGLLRIDLAVRDWARRDRAVAERLRRVDNRRMDYMRSLFGAFCPDEDDVEARCMLVYVAVDRQPLHRRGSRRAQPRGGAGAGAEAPGGLVGQVILRAAVSTQSVDAVRELFELIDEIEFVRLRETLERSSSLAEAAPKMGALGDWHLQRLHPEVEIDASGVPELPEGNTAVGHQGWFEFWRAWLTAWESFEYEPLRWHDGGDRVVVEFVQRGRLRGGLEYETPLSNVWTFEDEKVVRLQLFGTWQAAMKATAELGDADVR